MFRKTQSDKPQVGAQPKIDTNVAIIATKVAVAQNN